VVFLIKNSNIAFLEKKFYENKLSHVFLIETDDKILALEDIKVLVKIMNCPSKYDDNCCSCNICNLIKEDLLPTIKIIYPDGQAIKKSQMEELKNAFSCIPVISKYNVYVINDAEKFNASSANTMLKFIEEPEDKIIGFLITNNKENVINTIKSRCEIVKAYYNESNNIIDENLINLAIQYVYNLEIDNRKSIVYNKKIVDLKYEKSELILFFKYILDFYLKLLNKEEIDDERLAKINLSIPDIIKRINLVNETIDKLNYNVNINLLLDNFVLELED
jgi:DNA polymerase III delta prime subunit